MKIYKTGNFHNKNQIGIELLPHDVFQWNKETDGIVISNGIDEELINNPDYKFVIIGPGVDFAEGLSYFSQYIGTKKIVFNCLSSWLKNLHERYAPNNKVQYECIPFPVDVKKFKPNSEKKRRFFIYYKNVHSSRLNTLLEFLFTKPEIIHNYEHRIFEYGHYFEEDYLNYIREAEFGIWVGSHESQGFAFEEAMSCGCPLFVYDVKTLKDECIQDRLYPWENLQGEFPATTASYFDKTCGIIVKDVEDIPNQFNLFYNRLGSFNPRKYVLNHLTTKHFYEKVQSLFPETKHSTETSEMKNLVLITSVIHISSNPLSYTSVRSVYSPQERFIQTQKTIQSVREKIPNVKILLVECSFLSEEEEIYFKTHCDYFINVVQEPNMLCWTTGLSKALGEGSMTIKALDYIQQQGFEFDNLFKITGRYYLNEHFQYEKFINNRVCFRHNIGNESANTCVYKLPRNRVSSFCSFLKKNMDEMERCVQYELLFLRFILEQEREDVLEIDRLGITAFASVCGSLIDFY